MTKCPIVVVYQDFEDCGAIYSFASLLPELKALGYQNFCYATYNQTIDQYIQIVSCKIEAESKKIAAANPDHQALLHRQNDRLEAMVAHKHMMEQVKVLGMNFAAVDVDKSKKAEAYKPCMKDTYNQTLCASNVKEFTALREEFIADSIDGLCHDNNKLLVVLGLGNKGFAKHLVRKGYTDISGIWILETARLNEYELAVLDGGSNYMSNQFDVRAIIIDKIHNAEINVTAEVLNFLGEQVAATDILV